ncbi:hypothetical protein GGI11_004952 [Coemansia sp. RSA 2049]|nr:hypothetical protein GGI11_004952 [Coemansia sp. RSA 2049]
MVAKNLEEQQSAWLNHLHTASRMAFRICPQLAAFYGNEFSTALGSQKAANSVVRYQCPYCGSPLVDSRSVSRVSVVRTPQPQKGCLAKGGSEKLRGRAKKRALRTTKRKGLNQGNSCKRRVVKVLLSDITDDHTSETTKAGRDGMQKNIKNTVEYICGLCDSRVVYPGATASGLDAAGLSGGAVKPLRQPEITSSINSNAALQIKGKHTEANSRGSVRPPPADLQSNAVSVQCKAARPNKPPASVPVKEASKVALAKKDVGITETVVDAAQTDSQIKKRKRYKSNLLATLAANKKRSEDQKNNSSFNLGDFLSGL